MTPTRSPPPDARLLFERIRPRRLEDVLGDPHALRAVGDWARTWAASTRPPRWRALVLSGPPGVGKTTIAGVLASSFGWTLVEMNASDARNQTAIEEVAGRASLSHTLGDGGTYRTPSQGGRTLILLDEADSLSGRADSAGSARAETRSFREFLTGRYRDVAALSNAWGLGAEGRPPAFEAWSEVPTSGGRGPWNRLPEAQRDLADWRDSARKIDLSDRGGYSAMLRLVRGTQQPVVITVNDEGEFFRHAPAMRSLASRVRLRPISSTEMASFLAKTVRTEGLAIGAEAIAGIVRRSQGDLRAAINDLEAIAPLAPGPLQASLLATRDLTSDFYAVTRTVLTSPRFYRSVEIRDLLDANPEDLWPWIEENLPKFAPSPKALVNGFARLGEAEILVARARRNRVYGLWSFATEIMTGGAGVAIAGDAPARPGTVDFPEFLAAMGRSRSARAVRTALLAKLGGKLHLSRRKAGREIEPFLTELYSVRLGPRPDPKRSPRRALSVSLGLSTEEVAFLGGRPEDGPPSEDSEPAGSDALGDPEPMGTAPEPAPMRPTPGPREPPEAKPAPRTKRQKVQRRLGEF